MKEGEMTSEEQRLPERGLTSLSQGINSGSSLNLNPPMAAMSYSFIYSCLYTSLTL